MDVSEVGDKLHHILGQMPSMWLLPMTVSFVSFLNTRFSRAVEHMDMHEHFCCAYMHCQGVDGKLVSLKLFLCLSSLNEAKYATLLSALKTVG